MRRLLTSRTAQIIGAVASISGLVATLLLAPDVREWAREQGPWLLLVAAVLVVVLALLLGLAAEHKSELEERLAAASVEVAPHDTALFNRRIRELPASKGVIRRLANRRFRAKSFNWGNLSTLDQFHMDWEDDPSTHFVDSELEAAKDELVEAAKAFLHELAGHVWSVEGHEDRFTMDLRWMQEDARSAYAKEDEIIHLGLQVVEAYKSFLAVAHTKGLTGPTPSTAADQETEY